MNKSTKQKIHSGIVVSDKQDKTLVVETVRKVMHVKYKKGYSVKKKYKVHDEKNQYKEGDKVQFVPCRPLSKEKRFRVIGANQSNQRQ